MKNLARLNSLAQKQAATKDFLFVYHQLEEHNPPAVWPTHPVSARKIDQSTRHLLGWAKEHKIEVTLPEGWKP